MIKPFLLKTGTEKGAYQVKVLDYSILPLSYLVYLTLRPEVPMYHCHVALG